MSNRHPGIANLEDILECVGDILTSSTAPGKLACAWSLYEAGWRASMPIERAKPMLDHHRAINGKASPAAAAPLLQRLAAGDCLWAIVTSAEVQSLLRAGHAYIAATLGHRDDMVTLAITEEGRTAAENQRSFFRNLDDAEVKRKVLVTDTERAAQWPDLAHPIADKERWRIAAGVREFIKGPAPQDNEEFLYIIADRIEEDSLGDYGATSTIANLRDIINKLLSKVDRMPCTAHDFLGTDLYTKATRAVGAPWIEPTTAASNLPADAPHRSTP